MIGATDGTPGDALVTTLSLKAPRVFYLALWFKNGDGYAEFEVVARQG